MQNTLLFDVLSSLNHHERKDFAKFVGSPFFNTKPQIVALHDYLAQCITNQQPPEALTAFEAVFPTEKYEVAKARILASTLLRHFFSICF